MSEECLGSIWVASKAHRSSSEDCPRNLGGSPTQSPMSVRVASAERLTSPGGTPYERVRTHKKYTGNIGGTSDQLLTRLWGMFDIRSV